MQRGDFSPDDDSEDGGGGWVHGRGRHREIRVFAGAQRDALAEVTGDVLEGLEDVLSDVERIGDASKFVVDVNL